MTKPFYIFTFVILLAILLSLSCATYLPPPGNLTELDAQHSVIFGKLEVLNNDKPMSKPFPTSLKSQPIIMSQLSPYDSDGSLNTNLRKDGQYAFKVSAFKDGYFACVVPPGKYYFVEFDYLNFFDSTPNIPLRTYLPNGWQDRTPYRMTFDVPAARAVYIGTIRSHFFVKWENWIFVKGYFYVDATNNFAEAKYWFLKSNRQFETNIEENVVESHELP